MIFDKFITAYLIHQSAISLCTSSFAIQKKGPIALLFLGQTMGSSHIESQLRDPTGESMQRLDTDQTVFIVYKGVKTSDFCREKSVIVTGGQTLRGCGVFLVQ